MNIWREEAVPRPALNRLAHYSHITNYGNWILGIIKPEHMPSNPMDYYFDYGKLQAFHQRADKLC